MDLETAMNQSLIILHTRGKEMMKEEPGRTNLRMTIVTGVETPVEEPGIAILSLLEEMPGEKIKILNPLVEMPGVRRKTLNQLEKLGVIRKNLSHLEKLGEIRRHLSLQTHGAISQHKPAKEVAVGELNNLHITLYLSSL